jgi:SAM-dependent methyltransferase
VISLPWRDVAPGPGPVISTSLTAAETDRLRDLAAKEAVVLEVGSAYGYSTVAMALAGATVTAVDPHVTMGSREVFRANLGFYGVDGQVETVVEFSHDALPRLFGDGRRFDVAFIDGDHRGHVVRHDVEWALRLLVPGGVLACHDYGEITCPDVAEVLDEMFPNGPSELVDTLFVVRP